MRPKPNNPMKTVFALAFFAFLLFGCTQPGVQTTPSPLGTPTATGSPEPSGSPAVSTSPAESATPVPTLSAKPTPEPFPTTGYVFGESFELKIGQTIQAEKLTVTFSNVTEDSRCPSDVRCVWAGRVVVEFTAKIPNGNGTIEMTPNTRYPPKAGFGGYRLVLYDVNPYPSVKDPIKREAYSVTMAVEKTQSS